MLLREGKDSLIVGAGFVAKCNRSLLGFANSDVLGARGIRALCLPSPFALPFGNSNTRHVVIACVSSRSSACGARSNDHLDQTRTSIVHGACELPREFFDRRRSARL